MLEITVKLIPFGDRKAQSKHIETIQIGNLGTNGRAPQFGDYTVRFLESGEEFGYNDFDRSKGAVALLAHVLQAMGYVE